MFIFNTNIFNKNTLRKLAVLGVGLLLSIILANLAPQSASALMTLDNTPHERAKSYSYWKAIEECVDHNMRSTIYTQVGSNGATQPGQSGGKGAEGTRAGEWFDNSNAYVSVYPDGKLNCDQAMSKALSLWGWSDPKLFLQAMGYEFDSNNPPTWRRSNDNGNERVQDYREAVSAKVGNVFALFDNAAKHDLYLGIFVNKNRDSSLSMCDATLAPNQSDPTIRNAAESNGLIGNLRYTSLTIAEGEVTKSYIYSYSDETTSDTGRTGILTHASVWALKNGNRDPSGTAERYSCNELANNLITQQNANAFARWNAEHPDSQIAPGGSNAANQCARDEECEQEELTTSCVIESVGWLVCPIVGFTSTMTDLLYGWIQSYLVVQPLNLDTSSDNNTTYIAWTYMRNLANVAFVIAFLIIIYSQLTGAGISNYGVKKMLPRLIISAILVNLSYWLTAIAVDVSNIVGNNLYNILRDLPLGNIQADSNGWEAFSAWLLAGTAGAGITVAGFAITGAAAWGTAGLVVLYALIPIVLVVVLGLIVAFATLALRQALIIILIVVAPLAFVALLLPNTEKLYSTWRKTLTTLLIFYPLFSLLFGGAYIAGMIIIGSAGQHSEGSPAVGMTVLLGLAVTAIPLWLTPLIVKFSSGAMGQFAGTFNGKMKSLGINRAARGLRDKRAGLMMNETLGNQRNSRNVFGRAYRRIQNSSRATSDRNKVVEANNQAAYLETAKSEQLAQNIGNAEQLAQTLSGEQKTRVEAQKDTSLTYRQKLSEQKNKAISTYDQARFEESKSTSQTISPTDPLAVQIQEARDTQQEIDISSNRIRSAEGVLQQELAHELSTRPQMAMRAGGIDPRGASRVSALANSTLTDATVKAIASEKSTMSTSSVAELDAIMRNNTVSVERRAAAAGQIFKIGGDGDIHKTLDYAAQLTGSSEGELIQQQISSDMGARKPLSIGAADAAALAQGRYTGTFDSKVAGRLLGGKISPEALYGASADELQRIHQVVSSPTFAPGNPIITELKQKIADYKANPNTRPASPEIAALVDTIETDLR